MYLKSFSKIHPERGQIKRTEKRNGIFVFCPLRYDVPGKLKRFQRKLEAILVSPPEVYLNWP